MPNFKEVSVIRLPQAYEREIAVNIDGSWRATKDYKAICDENGNIYTIVSKDYKLVQHKEVVEAVRKSLDFWGYEIEKESIVLSRRSPRMLYKVILKQKDNKNGKVKIGIAATNSYDGRLAVNIMGYGVIYGCFNEMLLGRDILRVKKKHLTYVISDSLKELHEAVSDIVSGMSKINDIIEQAKNRNIGLVKMVRLVKSLDLRLTQEARALRTLMKYIKDNTLIEVYKVLVSTSMTEREKKKRIRVLAGYTYNVWDVYNGLSEFVTHHMNTTDVWKYIFVHNKIASLLKV